MTKTSTTTDQLTAALQTQQVLSPTSPLQARHQRLIANLAARQSR